jgi:enolase
MAKNAGYTSDVTSIWRTEDNTIADLAVALELWSNKTGSASVLTVWLNTINY